MKGLNYTIFLTMSIDLSLVLPCFNEEDNIIHLYDEFCQIPFSNTVPELIFVNNGSYDKTEKKIDDVIRFNKSKNNNIELKKINLKNNEGYGGGIIYGLKEARGKFIGWTHADLQTPLLDFFTLYNKIKSKKLVMGKGYRINNRGFDAIVTRMHEKCATFILGYKMEEINAQPKIFSRDLIELFDSMPKKWTVLDTYINYVCKVNHIEIVETNVVFRTRIYGVSKWKNNFKTFIKHIFFNFIYLFQLRLSKIKK